jgi:molybdate transport system ATP-binding protein
LETDIVIPDRGITSIFGPSGSGKTTLLRCVAGLEPTVRGTISVRGERWQEDKFFLPAHKRPVGYVFQEASLFPHLSVAGNLRYGLRRSATSRIDLLDRAVELAGIATLLERRPESLSGGERQRVAIARALCVDPQVLLMDEPLSGLDLARKSEILPYLERLHEELEIPILYVTHSAEEVVRLADHLVLLDAGRVRAQGTLPDLLSRLDPGVRLGGDPGAVLEGTVGERDGIWHLARIDFPGGALWARDTGIAKGRPVRLRVLARDVGLSLEPPRDTSILNLLPATVEEVGEDDHPGLALARVRVGSTALLARLTRRSAASLGIVPGRQVWAQVKSVALMDERGDDPE